MYQKINQDRGSNEMQPPGNLTRRAVHPILQANKTRTCIADDLSKDKTITPYSLIYFFDSLITMSVGNEIHEPKYKEDEGTVITFRSANFSRICI